MRNYGAATPHGAFTYNAESSNGGAKYRDKIYCDNYRDITCNNGNDNNNNTSDNSLENKCRYSPPLAAATKKSAKTSTATKMMRSIQSSGFHFSFLLCLVVILCLLPSQASCDDSDNTFFVNGLSPGLELTTPEFDYASRGKKKFGDKCDSTLECGFPGSTCDEKKKLCQCTEDLPVTNHLDKCGKKANINESCFFNEQCESMHFQTECHDGRCICRFEMLPVVDKDGNFDCKGNNKKREPETYIDPAMIGVLVGMALMFVIICVVLRLFSQARWRENRTIFNTPNPRLMNVSLLRDSKLLHGQERRGSRMSVRAPSRQPSMASLRPHSPNPSLGKTGSRPGSRNSSTNGSGTSLRSNRSNNVPTVPSQHNHERKNSNQINQNPAQQPLMTNITSNPVAESVTVEIIEPKS